MEIIQSVSDLHRFRRKHPCPIALVPTMGALHDGHCELIRQARILVGATGKVIVSIFVNPIQFDRAEDLNSYPVTRDEDYAICKQLETNAIFSPLSFYHSDRSITVTENNLSNRLCGATRPGHFDGVCTVVTKLFHASQADYAVFGKKDYQQLAIIQRMVRDLNLPIKIHGVETVREPSGLALSSRNLRLSEETRYSAPILREALLQAKEDALTSSPSTVLSKATEKITSAPSRPRIDYLELVDAETLQAVQDFSNPSVLATAVFFGDVRLIDNIEIPPQSS